MDERSFEILDAYSQGAEDDPDAGAHRDFVADALETFIAGLDSDTRRRVLDVGCGPGWDTAALVKRGCSVIGVDIVAEFLRTTRRRSDGDASVARMDMRSLGIDRAVVDGVWNVAAFYHVSREDAPGTAAEFHRVLRSGGRVFCSVLRPDDDVAAALADTPLDAEHITFWEPDSFRTLFREAGFSIEHVETPQNWIFLHATA